MGLIFPEKNPRGIAAGILDQMFSLSRK